MHYCVPLTLTQSALCALLVLCAYRTAVRACLLNPIACSVYSVHVLRILSAFMCFVWGGHSLSGHVRAHHNHNKAKK